MAIKSFNLSINFINKRKINIDSINDDKFNNDFTIKQPKKTVNNASYKKEIKKELNNDKVSKLLTKGYELVENKSLDLIRQLLEKYKDKKIKINTQDSDVKKAIYNLFGEEKTELTFNDYYFVIMSMLKIGNELANRGAE